VAVVVPNGTLVPAVITGAHAIIFTKDADGVRAFLRDVLGLSSVDAGGGWPVFGLPPAELAVHPTDGDPHDELYLMTDDLYATVAKLQDRGVKFTRPIKDAGWGLLTALELPDGRELALYEPRHPRPPSVGQRGSGPAR
jgi:catechol 2,3-dioxygenase-like lactoylglutathione lyase family enzyme